MSESTMYETLMSLPLFSGASCEQFARLVERCNLDFKTYEPGETVIKPENSVRTLKCLVSGRLVASHSLFNGRVKVIEEVVPGRFLGAERLFGLNNHLHYKAVAKVRSGTMEVDKHQYLNLLAENPVFLLNLLNYLSRPMQQFQDNISEAPSFSLICIIASLLECTTTRDSENIMLISTGTSLADVLTHNHQNAAQQFRMLENCGYIKVEDANHIRILDRNRFIELIGDSKA